MAKDDVYRTKKKDGVLVAPDFREKLIQNNPKYSSGYTNYEQYYTDLDGFWRTLYHSNPPKEYFERAYSDTTPNKHVYEYKECVLAEK
jgi:hypothetical protein